MHAHEAALDNGVAAVEAELGAVKEEMGAMLKVLTTSDSPCYILNTQALLRLSKCKNRKMCPSATCRAAAYAK